MSTEITFDVTADEEDGGFVAVARGVSIVTQGDDADELKANVREAVRCHFGDGVPGPMPEAIRLHFVREEVLAV